MKGRRRARVLSAALLVTCGAGCAPDTSFHSAWGSSPDRRWVGSDFWANRLQDWRVASGRLEAVTPLPMRTVHLLTRRMGEKTGDLSLSVVLGPRDAVGSDGTGSSAGFLIGAGRDLDYRAASLIHHSYGPGAGFYAGVDTDGRVFLRDIEQRDVVILETDTPRGPVDSVSFMLSARHRGSGYEVSLRAALWNAERDTVQITTGGIAEHRLAGNIALVSDTRGAGGTTFWFSRFTADGPKLRRHADRAAGPVLGTQHTLSRGTLKLTAQFMPIDDAAGHSAELQTRGADDWATVATAPIVAPGYTATFTVRDWDDGRDAPFRVAYDLAARDGTTETHSRGGTIRRNPLDREEIVVAAFTGNHNVQTAVNREWFPWDQGVWFPHSDIVGHVRAHDPQFLFFSGDQVYEGASPTRADFEHPYEDYLYKWYLWLWAFGELTAEIPTVTIPDDHDVFHGNVWGAGGRATPRGLTGAAAQDAGGYKLPAEWVNMVQRTQTSHLPDPYDPTPVEQGIGVYYTDLLYGGVSFAVLEDRKFKSAPATLLPVAEIRNGWSLNPQFDATSQADAPAAVLLGDRQLGFLEQWASDWSDGTWMKVVLSQTLFANVATLPVGEQTGSVIPSLEILSEGEHAEGEYMVSDMDSNGWPQMGRNRALRAMRKGFAVHLSGDQHLGSTVQYGIDGWRDARFALCVPSVANFWPRRWYPPEPGANRDEGAPRYTGDYEDGFGNKMTVLAVSNPSRTGREPAALHDRAPGYGIARFNRRTRDVSLAAWPRWADPASGGRPYRGWPITFAQEDNYSPAPVAFLPQIEVSGMEDPVVQVVHEVSGAVVYTIRIRGRRFLPPVYAAGNYTVRVGEPGTERWTAFTEVESRSSARGTLSVVFE